MLEVESKFHEAMNNKNYRDAHELAHELRQVDPLHIDDRTKRRIDLLDFFFEHGDSTLNPKQSSLHHRAIVRIGLSIRHRIEDQVDIQQLDLFIKRAIDEAIDDVRHFSKPPINLILFEAACQVLASIAIDIETVEDYSDIAHMVRGAQPSNILDLIDKIRGFPFDDVIKGEQSFNYNLKELMRLLNEATKEGINPSLLQPRMTEIAWERLINRLEEISDQNEQLRNEFETRIKSELSAMQTTFNERLQEELDRIHQPLNRHVSKTETVEIEIAMVRDRQESIQDQLSRIQRELKQHDQNTISNQADLTQLQRSLQEITSQFQSFEDNVNRHVGLLNGDFIKLSQSIADL
ncbi:MAG: hypothetical protein ACOYLB_17240, partial [Phototrophicaceae bacterium]